MKLQISRYINRIKYFFLPGDLKKRWPYEDYLYFRLQYMKVCKIREFLTGDELWAAEKLLNSDEYRHIFNSKKEFYYRFKKYMKREIIFLDEVDEDQYIAFVRKHGRIVVKPDDMYAGIGFNIATVNENGDIDYENEALSFSDMKEKHYLAEEYVIQAREYMEAYDKSLNTIRVTTFVDKEGRPGILFVVNQFGSMGSIVDNDDIDAIWYITDKETGKVLQSEIDEDNGFVYDIHPDSGKNMLDFVNPVFEEIKKTALQAASEIKECRLIGWDIAVTKDYEIEIIEGNVTPELYLYQFITGDGLARINR